MNLDLSSWLRKQSGGYALDIPLLDVAFKAADDKREWLVANGLGSYASANIWGANSRCYHGLFVAALEPPVKRHLMWTRIDEVVQGVELGTSYWASGAVSPEGYRSVAAFTIYPVPTWLFTLPAGNLIKQVFVVPGKQEAVVGYTWLGDSPVEARFKLITNFRDFHGRTRGADNWRFKQELLPDRVVISAYDGAKPLVIAFSDGSYTNADAAWYWQYRLPREKERGLESLEDNFYAGTLSVTLSPGQELTLRAGLDPFVSVGSVGGDVRLVASRHGELVRLAACEDGCRDPQRLVLAADAFVVARREREAGESAGKTALTVIAGYHWFNDWGRDTMISLPGIMLCTGRPEEARATLANFARYLSEGMLPNNFPDVGASPDYNTADATLWWAWTLWRYHQATSDLDFVRSQLPLLSSVVDWHLKGTRYNLKVDCDGLVTGGQEGVQLTWMDAKCGDYVVTPRRGKPVEINALWYNFLRVLEHLSATVGSDGTRFATLAGQVLAGFAEYWNEQDGCLYDVIRADGSKDASVRPNQLLAVSLPFAPVEGERAKRVLGVVERDLWTPYGLRTLSVHDPAYSGRYGGNREEASQWDRDLTYHQGTVWPWLLGAWVDARMKVYGDTADNTAIIRDALEPIRRHIIDDAGLGSVSEIFDGDPPHRASGCICQAWSVAELLRVLRDYPRLQ